MQRLISLLGIPALLLIAFIFCKDRRRLSYKIILGGIGLQFIFALVVLRTRVGHKFFYWVGRGAEKLIGFTQSGSSFVFGELMNVEKMGFILAFQVLPVIIFFSSLSAILYHFGILQWLVRQMARVFTRTLGVSGAEALSVAANVFVGMRCLFAMEARVSPFLMTCRFRAPPRKEAGMVSFCPGWIKSSLFSPLVSLKSFCETP